MWIKNLADVNFISSNHLRKRKGKLNYNDKELFQKHVDRILISKTENELYQQLKSIYHSVEYTANGCNYWMDRKIFNTFYSCIVLNSETNTNNNIESLHSNFVQHTTPVLNFREAISRYIDLYLSIDTVAHASQDICYTLNTQRRTFLKRQNKHLAREAHKKNKSNKIHSNNQERFEENENQKITKTRKRKNSSKNQYTETYHNNAIFDGNVELQNNDVAHNEEKEYNFEKLEKKLIDRNNHIFYLVKWK